MPQNIIEAADTYDVALQAPLDGEDANVASLLLYMQGGANRLRFLKDGFIDGKRGGTSTPSTTIIIDGVVGPNLAGLEVEQLRVRNSIKRTLLSQTFAVPPVIGDQSQTTTPSWEGGTGYIQQVSIQNEQTWIKVPTLPASSTLMSASIRLQKTTPDHSSLPTNKVAFGFVRATSDGVQTFLQAITQDPSGDQPTYDAEHNFSQNIGAQDQLVTPEANYYIVLIGEFNANSLVGMRVNHCSVITDITEIRF